ncbi:MAG: HAMP domain-containing protein [Magnetococcales bacterium]|nr:HAMP domain-containing protein [Magnetococcales bacterium]
MPPLYSKLNHIRFRGKSFILMGIMIVCFSAIGTVFVKQYQNLSSAQKVEEHHDEIIYATNKVIYQIVDLHLSVIKFKSNPELSKLLEQLDSIRDSILLLEKKGGHPSVTGTLMDKKNSLGGMVVELFALRKKFGLNEDLGERGSMRSIIHTLERTLLVENLSSLTVGLLQLRRREKDVFLRGHDDSQELFELAMSEFKLQLAANKEISEKKRQIVRDDIDLYYKMFISSKETFELIRHKTDKIMLVTNDLVNYTSRLINEQQNFMRDNMEYQRDALQATSIHLVVALVFTFVVLGTLLYLLLQSILLPVNILNKRAKNITAGDTEETILLYGTDEIGELARSLEHMKDTMLNHQKDLENMVEQRTQHLDVTNTVLRDIIVDLNKAQEELVQSEKMASLGRLVAGFAHEINTPIGVAVSTISHIPDMTKQLETMLSGDEVDGDELDQLLENLGKASNLGMSNLNKAADLVRRFKRTSMDQTSEDIRDFNVYDLFQDIITTLHSVFKNTKINLKLECPKDLNICSQPGIIGQVLTNLLMNSFKHGFKDGSMAGNIIVAASFDGDSGIRLKFSDDGCGIGPETLPHIFEPFVTTARSTGGSGLGLYLSYNIITVQLNGEISCKSEIGKGVVFDIHIPNIMQVKGVD